MAAGIGLAEALPGVPPLVWVASGVGVAGTVAIYARATRRRIVTLRPIGMAVAVGALAVMLGASRDTAWRTVRPDAISQIAEAAWRADSLDDRAPITLWATVADTPERTWAIRFLADVDSAARGETRGAVTGRVQVALADGEGRAVYPLLRAGDRVRLTGRLEPRPRRRNPAQMDYGAYLERQGIGAMLQVEGETEVVFLGPSRRPSVRLANAVARRGRESLGRYVSDPGARALLSALLLADRSGIDEATLDAFRETGLMHLLAVSGLHVGLVGLTLYALLKPILGRLGIRRRRVEWARTVVTLMILTVYAVVAGASVSVVRAFVMVAVVLVGRALEKPGDALNTLGLAAVAILVHRPAALFDVGFQLSFGAVAALVTLTPLLTAAVPERVRQSRLGVFVVGSVVTSLAATLGTAPALLAHFGRLPIGGLILNLPAIPLTALTLGSGIGCVLTAWAPPLAAAFGAAANGSGQLLIGLTETGAGALGGIAYERVLDAPSVLVACVLVLIALAVWRRPVARRRLIGAAVASAAVGVWSGFARGDAQPVLDVVFLDVGQGDATLISTPGGRHVLIDAGLRSPYVDEGERVIVPHLERFGIRRLDALVLTHADADHIGGARSVLLSVPVGRLVVNGQPGETDLWNAMLRTADSLGVPIQAVRAGDTLPVDPAVRFRVLGPARRHTSANDASIVLRVEHGVTRWLLTGDAEVEGEADLVSRFPALLAADVVHVGHHGSRTSSIDDLVHAAGDPAFAVVSVARRNRYGLPDEEPLARWQATGAAVLLTSQEGAVWLRSDGRAVTRRDWRSE